MEEEVQLVRVDYSTLNSRQKENFNFQKVSAILADYGFVTLRLSDDWQGADFIAQHIDGVSFLKVQLKSRLTINKKYLGKDLWIAFNDGASWYLFPHDAVTEQILAATDIGTTASWMEQGGYSFPGIPKQLFSVLAPHRILGDTAPIASDSTAASTA
jgi:hypothetical protein